MAADETSVSILSLEDFRQRLERRMEEAGAALLAVLTPPGSEPPALGEFHHAKETALRHGTLNDEYADGLRRLVGALSAAQTATAQVVERYRTAGDLANARVAELQAVLRPVEEALNGGQDNG
ncbi:hypothetical protein GCM10022251_25290 [Phytohabitans flavus]|uniref:Uncharacterized protein n=1 Tax=Phytohabitans flavus TaxID=1076124 RepID=A0A6F8XR33_9ACTN|nr:hypothetical protein [Phytohabitans flavus]BCB76267.1 hypothetical protein Pflav_026770 [Phytohabitans flavus]